MLTAQQLTDVVAARNPDRSLYRGVSDHIPHCQLVQVVEDKEKLEFVLVTFNVLTPRCVPYMTGIPLPGTEMPKWFTGIEDQFGLEKLPAFQPDAQERRGEAVYAGITRMIDNGWKLPFVICLQECDPVLYGRLKRLQDVHAFHLETSKDPKETSFCAILVSSSLGWHLDFIHPQWIVISLPKWELVIVSAHLDFSTESNFKHFDSMLAHEQETGMLICGDFNIQTTPLSPASIKEGKCTMVLTEFAAALESRTGMTARFGVHPRGWTNWNIRMNVVDRERNHDHYDQIMILSRHPEAFALLPCEIDVTME